MDETPAGRIDEHIHTYLSDGYAAPAEVVRRAAELGLARIAITDHDCVDAHREREWDAAGVPGAPEVVTGVEIDCSLCGLEIEILGYGFDPHAPALVDPLDRVQRERRARFRFYCEVAARAGEPIDPERVLGGHTRAPLKVHLFRALQANGRLFPGGYVEFRDHLAALGEPPPLHRPTAAEAVGWVRAAGGAALVAHPLYYAQRTGWPALVEAARDAGCVGAELAYPYDAGDSGMPRDAIGRDLRALAAELRRVFPRGARVSSGTDVHDLAEWEARLERVARWRQVVGPGAAC
jgi:3',5'-nucleoside bisphosphate phosphatase